VRRVAPEHGTNMNNLKTAEPPVDGSKSELVGKSLAGRCCSGYQRSRRVIHAVPYVVELGAALCGATPGQRSAGWTSVPDPLTAVNCFRCLRLLPGKNPRKVLL